MMNNLLQEAFQLYRQSDVRLTLPYREHQSLPGYARLSAFNTCPLRHAYEKLKTTPDMIELTPNKNTQSAWIMEHGNYVAPMIQEALMYYAMIHKEVSFEPEVPVVDHQLKVSGRMDGLLNGDRVLEIKDVEGLERRSIGEPKLGHCLQTLAYCMVTGISHASIICVSKWGFNVYDLEPERDGYLIYHRDQLWQPPRWSENFNDPGVLNFNVVKYEIGELHRYMDIVEARDDFPSFNISGDTPPIEDPLNNPKGWLCVRHLEKATRRKDGKVVANCPWAQSCHGIGPGIHETEMPDDKIVLKSAF